MRAGEEKHTRTQKGPHLVAARELAGKAIQLLEPEDVPVPEPEQNLALVPTYLPAYNSNRA